MAGCPYKGAASGLGHVCPEQAALDNADPNPVCVAFGVGSFRCPGRAFAHWQLRLAVATLFSRYNLRHIDGQKVGEVGVEGRGAYVPRWLQASTVPGRHVFARGVTSGDREGLLPQGRPQLLVGVKRPVGRFEVYHGGRESSLEYI
jgi:hypothetical protein